MPATCLEKSNLPDTITATEFKAKCLKLMDEVAATGQSITITKRGKPIAKITPDAGERPQSLYGFSKGVITVTDPNDDLIAPACDESEWDACR